MDKATVPPPVPGVSGPSIQDFRNAACHWATGVAVITTVDKVGNPYGLTMNAVAPLSVSPLQFLMCVDNNSASLPPMLESRIFCINFLSSHQEDLARRFASKGNDKFKEVCHLKLTNNLPALRDVLAYIVC